MWTNKINKTSKMSLLAWEKETGIQLVQINGERYYGGPPQGWVGSPPIADTEVYIGQLPHDVYENTLIPLFERVGKLYEFRLMLTFNGFNRGFAYARYASRRGARRAIATFHCFQLRQGCVIEVCWRKEKCEHVNNLLGSVSQQELEPRLHVVSEGIHGITLHASPFQRQAKLTAVNYRSHEAATLARKPLMEDPNCETATMFNSAEPKANSEEGPVSMSPQDQVASYSYPQKVLVNPAMVSTPTDAYTASATGFCPNVPACAPASVITAAAPQTAAQPVMVPPYPVGRPAVSSVPFPIYPAPFPPASVVGEASAVLPAYSLDPSGSDLPRDTNVLRYYFNLGLQCSWSAKKCCCPCRKSVQPVMPPAPMEVYPACAEPAPVLDCSVPQLYPDAGQAATY